MNVKSSIIWKKTILRKFQMSKLYYLFFFWPLKKKEEEKGEKTKILAYKSTPILVNFKINNIE